MTAFEIIANEAKEGTQSEFKKLVDLQTKEIAVEKEKLDQITLVKVEMQDRIENMLEQ